MSSLVRPVSSEDALTPEIEGKVTIRMPADSYLPRDARHAARVAELMRGIRTTAGLLPRAGASHM